MTSIVLRVVPGLAAATNISGAAAAYNAGDTYILGCGRWDDFCYFLDVFAFGARVGSSRKIVKVRR